jgi:hypothetical protein
MRGSRKYIVRLPSGNHHVLGIVYADRSIELAGLGDLQYSMPNHLLRTIAAQQMVYARTMAAQGENVALLRENI